MRKIKFKGESIENNCTVFGGYYKIVDDKNIYHYIVTENHGTIIEVKHDSICQFIGIYDVNKREIYENCKCKLRIYNQDSTVSEYIGTFKWENELGAFFDFFNSQLNCRCNISLFNLIDMNYTVEILTTNSKRNRKEYSTNTSEKTNSYKDVFDSEEEFINNIEKLKAKYNQN